MSVPPFPFQITSYFMVVLHKKAVSGDIVTVDDDAAARGIDVPAHAIAVVCPPRPDVIQDDVAAVDYEAIRRAARCCAADTEEHIGKNRWIRGVVFAARITGSDLQQRGRGRWASIEENSRDHDS